MVAFVVAFTGRQKRNLIHEKLKYHHFQSNASKTRTYLISATTSVIFDQIKASMGINDFNRN